MPPQYGDGVWGASAEAVWLLFGRVSGGWLCGRGKTLTAMAAREQQSSRSDFPLTYYHVIFQNLADCTTALTIHLCFGEFCAELWLQTCLWCYNPCNSAVIHAIAVVFLEHLGCRST